MFNKRILLVLPVLLLVSLACNVSVNLPEVNLVTGSGNVVTQERSVSNFDRVDLRGIGDLVIIQGDRESLVIEAEDNIIDKITTEVSGGELSIGTERNFNFNPTKPVRYTLTVKELKQVELSGFGNIEMDEFNGQGLSVTIAGSGNLEIGRLAADSLEVVISGFGSAEVNGTAVDQRVKITGSGNYNADDVRSQSTRVEVTGFGSATIWTQKSLDVTISGSGNVNYYGSPSVSQSITGFGTLNNLGEK